MADAGPSVEVGDHLSRHPGLSLLAIGLAVHIRSLPDGSPVGIKPLAERFPEGEVRIAGGLRELEAAGYLERERVRTEGGRVVTRTVFYSSPKPDGPPPAPPTPPADRAPLPEPESVPELVSVPERGPAPGPGPAPEPLAAPAARAAAPAPERGPAPALPPEAPAPVRDVAVLPEPPQPPGRVRREAVELLARLRGDDPRLLLGERDVLRLAPGVSAWLERGAEPEAVRRVLVTGLPDDMRSPAGVIGYRLRAGLPPELPREAPKAKPVRPDPLQNCDGCDRAFRAPTPGRCPTCPPEELDAAA
ncbi:helix-turn-helix domain-containing protein [Streptomyces sp. NPDC000075]|uniref:helix-turn-helix domain-containing protein n=1 Tax=Streptomyces TaxID=1883 RepID=UPI0031DC26D8